MSLFSLALDTLRRANDEYEMQRRGLLQPSAKPDAHLFLGVLCQPAWLSIRMARDLRDANNKRLAKLQREAFERAYPIGPDEWAIVCPYQLGDVYLYCALAKGLLAHHGGKRVIFFTKPQHAFIPRLFPSISETIAIEPPFNHIHIGRHVLNPHPADVNRGAHFKPTWGVVQAIGYGGMTMLDAMRATLRLPRTAPHERPRAPDSHERDVATKLLQEHHLTPGRVVILCPDATSTVTLPRIPEAFWDALIIGLRARSLQPVTNLGGPARRALKGAPGLEIPLEAFRAVACVAGHVISNRSGISDLISDLPLNQAVLFPAGSFYCGTLIESTGFRAMGWSDNVIELEIDCSRWHPALAALLAAMDDATRKRDNALPDTETGGLVANNAA